MKKIVSLIAVLFVLLMPLTAAAAQDDAVLTAANEMPFEINAKACVLMDVSTGTVLTGKNEHNKLYPASITKVMSLILVMEAIETGKLTLDMKITCSESAAEKGGSQIWLEAGEIMTVDELLKATVVYSANDACCLLAETVAGSETGFTSLMNKKAEELGMSDTHFDNCSGLDDDTETHLSTAYDIALMSRELLKYELIRNYTGIWMDTLRNGETQLINTNKLIRTYPGATGLKTGTTSKAGCCVSASAERDGMELVAVVLGADNSKERFKAASGLLDWGFSNFEIYSPDAAEKYPEIVKVNHGVLQNVELTHENCSSIVIKKGAAGKIAFETQVEESVAAPVKKGQNVGKVIFTLGDEIIGECIIKTAQESEIMTFGNAVYSLLRSFARNL